MFTMGHSWTTILERTICARPALLSLYSTFDPINKIIPYVYKCSWEVFHIIGCLHFNLSDIQLSHKLLMLVTNKRLPCESMWHVWSDLCPWVYNMCPLTWYLQEMAGLECGHQFCAGCWTDYLTSKIIDEGMGQTISCAAYACDILVDDVTVM